MTIAKRWAGHAWGTNAGKVFVILDGGDDALAGTLRFNEPGVGIAIYNVSGFFSAPTLKLTGEPQVQIEGVAFGELSVSGVMNGKGEINGDWETTLGTAGTFVLYPHVSGEEPTDIERAEQFHTARFNFGAIEIDKSQIIEIANNIRRDFPSVIITIIAGTEQARYLEDFRQVQFSMDRAEVVRIFAQKPDGTGANQNQVISIEFGPQVNMVMTQGANEAWVLGQLETLKRDLKRFERTYVTNFKKWGIGINQIMLLSAITFLPSLHSFLDRYTLIGIILILIFFINFMHSRYLPYAQINLRDKNKDWIQKFWPKIASWGIGIIAAIIASLAAAYLQGALQIPSPPASIENSKSK